MQRLDCNQIVAVGLLEMLWHFTGRYAPQGDVGRWSDARIAAGVSWPGDPGQLVTSLVASGWLEAHPKHRLIVHDWHDHADEATKKHLVRKALAFLSLSRPRRARGGGPVDTQSPEREPMPLPLPEPSPTPEPENGSEPAALVLSHWLERSHTELRSGKVRDDTLKRIRSRLKEGFSVEDLKRCVDVACYDEFYVAQGYYKQPDVIWRNSERVQKLLAKAQHAAARPLPL